MTLVKKNEKTFRSPRRAVNYLRREGFKPWRPSEWKKVLKGALWVAKTEHLGSGRVCITFYKES